jgi:hypothetical protein
MFKKIAQRLGLAETPAEAVARRVFSEEHSELRCDGATTRATEESRFVVAVFYDDPKRPARPSPYKLYAVARDLSTAEELSCSPDSPYWIRGRK